MNSVLAVSIVVIKELYRKKDFYVLLVLALLIIGGMSIAGVLGDEKTLLALKEICFLLIWISGLVIAVGTSVKQFPAERENRTIFPLLAKPVTRGEVIAGKFLGCWLACGVALAIFYFLFGILGVAFEHDWPWGNFLEALWMQWMFLAIIVALALWGSFWFASPAANATVCVLFALAVMLLGNQLATLALKEPEPLRSTIYTVYFLLPHFEWFNLKDFVVTKNGTIGAGFCAGATVYAVSYAGFFLMAAWTGFRRKALN